MKYAKVFGILLSAGMLSVSCGEPVELGEPVHLFGHITEEPIALMDYLVCDGEQTISYRVPSESKVEYHEEIFTNLQKVEACPVLNSEMPEPTYPIYSVFALDEGETAENVEFAWSDGYLYNRDGTVYAFDFDFDSLIDDYEMIYQEDRDVKEGVSVYCRYYIAQDANGWKKEWLTLDSSEAENPGEVIAEQTEVYEDHVEVTIRNVGERALRYWIIESVDVKLDGAWYNVPRLPGDTLWDCPVDLVPGTSAVYSCVSDGEYGFLPAGEYRVKIPVTFEGIFESENESLPLYCEFTIE